MRVRRDRDGLLNDELPPAAGAAEASFGLEAALLAEFERARGLPDEQLRAVAGAEPHALGKLDDRAAIQALRLEREHTHHQDAARKQTERASELEQQATGLGWRARHEREQLRHNANLQRDHTARHSADAERIALELSRLLAAGRPPDQWLREHGARLASGIAASRELEQRHEREIDRQAQSAVIQPPAHVRELIDDRPVSGVRLAQDWERLAGQIERHRLAYDVDVDVDVDRDGPLGPDPSRIAMEHRYAYEQQRLQLASEVEVYRQARGFPGHEQAREISAEREQAFGREL